MSSLITTGSIARLMQPGLRRIFLQEYPTFEREYSRVFKTLKSDKNFEIDQSVGGLGRAQIKDQGNSVNVDSFSQGYSPKYPNITVANSYWATMESVEDELYNIFNKGAKNLAFSMEQAKEQIGANVFNNGFDSGFTMVDGDGQPLFSTSHPLGPQDNDTFANTLTVATSLSRTAVEEVCTQIRRLPDSRGLRINLKGNRLVVPPELEYQACRITDSVLEPDTGNNAVNAINHRASKGYGMLKDGYFVYDYLENAFNWFITIDNCPSGLTHFQRRNVEFEQDNAFTNMNIGYMASERYSFGWSDARGCFGVQGQ